VTDVLANCSFSSSTCCYWQSCWFGSSQCLAVLTATIVHFTSFSHFNDRGNSFRLIGFLSIIFVQNSWKIKSANGKFKGYENVNKSSGFSYSHLDKCKLKGLSLDQSLRRWIYWRKRLEIRSMCRSSKMSKKKSKKSKRSLKSLQKFNLKSFKRSLKSLKSPKRTVKSLKSLKEL
jgi:hypothetical protein